MQISTYFLRKTKRGRLLKTGVFVLGIALCLAGIPALYPHVTTAGARLLLLAVLLCTAVVFAVCLLQYLFAELHHRKPQRGDLVLTTAAALLTFLAGGLVSAGVTALLFQVLGKFSSTVSGMAWAALPGTLLNVLCFPLLTCIPMAALLQVRYANGGFWRNLGKWLRRVYPSLLLISLIFCVPQMAIAAFCESTLVAVLSILLTAALYLVSIEWQILCSFEPERAAKTG